MKIIVIVLRGKGKFSSADFVKAMLFDTMQDAETYCKITEDMDTKYWTHCEIVSNGEEIETIPE